MPQTKAKNGAKGRRKPTPDLMRSLPTRGSARSKKPAPTANEIADSIETEAKRLQGVADILRGKVA